jgi:hypothetical protein
MKKIFTLIVMLAATLGIQAQDTWTIAGDKGLMGVNWDPADASNDMTTSDNVNFTLTKTGMMVKAGNYGFKAVKNHAWGEEYPSQNAELTIDADGEYTIDFTFNADTKDVNAVANKTGEYVGPTTSEWFVSGSADIFGVEWSGDAAENKMSTEDGKIYTLVKTDVALNVNTPYPFKFIQNGAWLGNKGEGALGDTGMGGNFELFVDAPGKYTVTFTANEETMIGTVSAVKTGEAVFGEKVWTIAGEEALMGSGWDTNDTNNDMTDMGDGTFQLVKTNVTLEAKTYTYKVVANHSWSENYGGDYNDGNAGIEIEADGTYDVTFVFNPESKELYATADPASTESVKTLKSNIIANSVIYNLQGQRVKAAFRGIAIKNGRKVIVK